MTGQLPITAIHHIARVTERPDESIAFYCDVLGFRQIQRPPFNFRGAWLYNYGVQIHIIENRGSTPAHDRPIDPKANHLAFHVENVESAKQSLRAQGIEYIEQVNAGGIHQVFFRDPDGHFIEIATYGPTPDELTKSGD